MFSRNESQRRSELEFSFTMDIIIVEDDSEDDDELEGRTVTYISISELVVFDLFVRLVELLTLTEILSCQLHASIIYA